MIAVLGVVAAGAGADRRRLLAGDLGLPRGPRRRTPSPRRPVRRPAAAERASAAILSYDYESLDADEKCRGAVHDPGVPQAVRRHLRPSVKPNAAKVKAKVEAEVKASGVAHADADRVNVLLYVNQSTTSTANSGQPQVALNRVQLSMVGQGGTWLVDDITSY